MKSTKKGFTLVELLVVIAILAILATVSVVGYTAFIEKAHQSVAMQEMTQIRNALVAEDITNKNFNLEDGISGEGIETVYAAEGDPVGGQSEAFYVLEFVKELGIAGTFEVSEGKLLFSPAGKDATATCDFVTGEISTAKGALEDDDQSTEPVVCPHTNTTATGTDATCTEAGSNTITCNDCGATVSTEVIPATGHTPGEVTVENNVAPDCTTAGSYDNVVYCTVCSEEISRTPETIPATGHTWGEDTKCDACDAQKIVIQHTSSTTSNMTAEENNASDFFGLHESMWTIKSIKNNSTNEVGINKDKTIRLYADKTNGNGTAIEITAQKFTISSISIDASENAAWTDESGFVVIVNGNAVAGIDGTYSINASAFTIQNTYTGTATSESSQIKIKSIEIVYFIVGELVDECESKCATCQGCLDPACTATVCTNKCQGHHVCESKCETCDKCKNDACQESVCSEKCECSDDPEQDAIQTYSYTFTAKQFSANGTIELGGINWTLAGDGGYWGFDSNNGRGQQFGSGNNPYKSMTLVSASFTNVTEIIINTSAGATNIKLEVFVGDTLVDTINELTTSAKDYSIEVEGLSGEIKLVYTQDNSSKAIYIKSITVNYQPIVCTEHTWEDADCVTPKTCSTCGATEGEALGHSWLDATCQDPKTCSVCNATEGSTGSHNYVEGVCSVCSAVEPEVGEPTTVEIAIAGSTGAVSGKSISWTSGDVTVTNNQASSSTAIRTSDTDHYRCYKGSSFKIECVGMTQIVLDCTGYDDSAKYLNAWVTDIGNIDGTTVTNNNGIITVTFTSPVNELEITSLSAQARIASITVTYAN